MSMCCTTKKSSGLGWTLGGLFAILYILCFVWYWIRGGDASLQEFHLNSLRLAFFGFTGMNAASFIAGLVQAFIWGWIVALIWKPIHAKFCCNGTQQSSS